MAEFASAAFIGLIQRQMAVAGIAPPPGSAIALPPGGPPTAPIEIKRRLLAHAVAMSGAGFLIRIGAGIHAVASDPTLDALRRAADPADLFARWGRLERYHHSHHRVLVIGQEPGRADLCHVSSRPMPPSPLEDLAVLGLLAALMTAIGCRGIDVDLAGEGGPRPVLRDDHIVLADPLPPAASEWVLRWRNQVKSERPLPEATPSAGLAERIGAVLDDDPLRSWAMADMARLLGFSPRSLQRQLRVLGATYSGILRDARVRRAARAMIDAQASLAEIGYAAGFADQAHFTREFRRVLGATPGQWRAVAA